MMATTGCDGVVIGRGCLGRPWLFAELSAALTGAPLAAPPTLGEVAQIIRRHGELLAAHFGEDKGMRDIRKHIAWYLHGFPAGADLRRALALVKTLSELAELLDRLDPDVAFPQAATGPRGRQGSACSGGAAGGLVVRSRRLRGARRRGRYALRRLNRDGSDITVLRMPKYDVALAAPRSSSGCRPCPVKRHSAASRHIAHRASARLRTGCTTFESEAGRT